MSLLSALPVYAMLLALGGSPQRVPTADETRLYDEGTRALAAGDARAAEKAWKAGYEIAHDPAFLVHIGEAEEKAGAPGQAVESYRRYLREAPDAADRADIEQRVARLAPAAPSAAAPPGGAVETPGNFGDAPTATPPPAPSPAPAPAGPPAAAAPPATPAVPHADAEKPATATEEDSGWNRYNTTAVIAAGATLALLGGAAFYGAEASSKESDINRLVTFRYPPPLYSSVAAEYTSAMNDGRSDAHVARVLLIAAAGTGLVSAVFFVLDALHGPSETPAPAVPAVSVSLAPGGHGLGALGAWSWRF